MSYVYEGSNHKNFMNKDQPQISESKIQYTIKLSFHLLIYLVWTLVE